MTEWVSPLTGLSSGLATGLGLGMNLSQLRQRQEQLAAEQAYREGLLGLREEELGIQKQKAGAYEEYMKSLTEQMESQQHFRQAQNLLKTMQSAIEITRNMPAEQIPEYLNQIFQPLIKQDVVPETFPTSLASSLLQQREVVKSFINKFNKEFKEAKTPEEQQAVLYNFFINSAHVIKDPSLLEEVQEFLRSFPVRPTSGENVVAMQVIGGLIKEGWRPAPKGAEGAVQIWGNIYMYPPKKEETSAIVEVPEKEEEKKEVEKEEEGLLGKVGEKISKTVKKALAGKTPKKQLKTITIMRDIDKDRYYLLKDGKMIKTPFALSRKECREKIEELRKRGYKVIIKPF